MRELPDTLPSIVHKTEHCGFELYVVVTFYNGPKEIFITIAKEGSVLRGMLHIVAMLTSMLLRAGRSWESVKEKLLRGKFDPSDEKHNSIIHAVVDAVDECIRQQERVKQ